MAELSQKDIRDIAEEVKNQLQEKPAKKKMEFSKKWLIGCAFFTIVYVSLSYILSAFDKNPLETLSGQIFEAIWKVDSVSIGAYALQNCVRAYSEDKFCKGNHRAEKKGE